MSDSPSPAELRQRKWADLPATPAVDAALRRAAAGVCGMIPSRHDRYLCERTGKAMLTYRNWHPQRDRNQLARVFGAARDRIGQCYDTMEADGGFWQAWIRTLDDPRAALCALLELLAIDPPEDICNNDGEREGLEPSASPNTERLEGRDDAER